MNRTNTKSSVTVRFVNERYRSRDRSPKLLAGVLENEFRDPSAFQSTFIPATDNGTNFLCRLTEGSEFVFQKNLTVQILPSYKLHQSVQKLLRWISDTCSLIVGIGKESDTLNGLESVLFIGTQISNL